MKSPTRRDLLGGFTLKLVLFLVMVELVSTFAPACSHTSFLVPSQVAQPRRSKNNGSKVSLKKHRIPAGFLVPSQVLKSHPDDLISPSDEVADASPIIGPLLTNRQKRRSRGKKPKSTNYTETGSYESTAALSSKDKAAKQKNKKKGLTGDVPDIKW
jgi:hypothetical protein